MVDRFPGLLSMSGIPDLLEEFFPGWVGVGNFESRPRVIFGVLATSDGDNPDSMGSNCPSGPASVPELKEHSASPDWEVFGSMVLEIRTVTVFVCRGEVSMVPSSTSATR